MWIQFILLVALGVVTALLTRSTATAQHQAIRRLFLVVFVILAGVSVLFPEMLSHVANVLGVGRGTDLLLYVLVVVFLGYVSATHRRLGQLNRKLTVLARELALAEAPEAGAGVPPTATAQP